MKLNYFTKRLPSVKRWIATSLLCLSAITFVWQGAFLSNTAAIAAPKANLIAEADLGSKIQGKTSEDAGRAKNFIRDTADKVKETANKNAGRVEEATDGKGNFVQRKARRDAARIRQRADEDAARTQKAVDKTKNAVESTVDNIKDTFSN
jgi:RNA repair, ligase-Pnkp-associating, region of Hen1